MNYRRTHCGYAHRLGDPPIQRVPGYIGSEEATLSVSDGTHIHLRNVDPTYTNYEMIIYTEKDSFDLNNWLKSTFSSEDNVKLILKSISPHDYKQLMGFYLTSKDGEGKGPASKNVLFSGNIDEIMELFKSLSSIQDKIDFKQSFSTGRMKVATEIKRLADWQNIKDDILKEYSEFAVSEKPSQLMFKESGIEYIYEKRSGNWHIHDYEQNYYPVIDLPPPTVLQKLKKVEEYFEYKHKHAAWVKKNQ